MKETINVPYVKKYNNDGEVINPIKGIYHTQGPNRKERRSDINEPRFIGNGKNYHLTVHKISKFKRVVQVAWNKTKLCYKNIKHYIACK